MGNSVTAPPPIRITIHHSILDEPITTAISDPDESYSSLAQRIIETDFYSHCKLLPLLQSIYPTKLSAYQLLFGGNRAIIIKPCWSTAEDDACLDVNVALRIREANGAYVAPPSPNSSILNTLPHNYAPNQQGRRPALELEMVCTKIRKFGTCGSYVRADDTLTKLIKCEPHPEGRGYIHAKIIDWDQDDEDCAIPERWVCQFDSDDEEEVRDVSTIASRVEALHAARAMTREAERDEASEAQTNTISRIEKKRATRRNKKKSKAGASQAENIIGADKGTAGVDTSNEPSEIQTKNNAVNIKNADPKLSRSRITSMSSREEIIEAARAIAEEENSALDFHSKKDTSRMEIVVEANATEKGETSKEPSDVQPIKKAAKKKSVGSKGSSSQTKNIASREEIIEAAQVTAEEETKKTTIESQSIKKAAKKKNADTKASGSPSKKIASREEIIESAKAIAAGETSRGPSDTQTMKNMLKTKHVESKAGGSQTKKREEIIEAGKAIAQENAKDVGMNGQLLEYGNEHTKPPTATKDDKTQAKGVPTEKTSNSNVGESRSKAKGRKENGTKLALEEAVASPRINQINNEGVDGNKASSGSPTMAKSGKTASNAPTKTAVEKAKTRVRAESVSNDSQSNLKSVKKQKVDDGLSSTFSPTKVNSGKNAKVVDVANLAASKASGQLGGDDKATAKKDSQQAKHLQAEKKTDPLISIAVSGATDYKNDDSKNDAAIVKKDSHKKTISTLRTAKASGQNDASDSSPQSPKAAGKMVSLLEHAPYSQSHASQKQSTLEMKKIPTDELFKKKQGSKPSILRERDVQVPAEPLKGFPEGWTQRRFPRSNTSGSKTKEDLFFYTPKMNIKLRSKTQAKDLLEKLAETGGDEILAWGKIQTGAENKDKKRKRTSTVEENSNDDNATKEDVNARNNSSAAIVTATPPLKKKAKSGKSKEKSNDSSKRKADNDPDKPKHPQNSFLLYANSVRSKVAAENPHLSGHEVITKISQMWQSLESAKKQYFTKQAEKGLEKYKTAIEEYKKRKANNDAEIRDEKFPSNNAPSSPVKKGNTSSELFNSTKTKPSHKSKSTK